MVACGRSMNSAALPEPMWVPPVFLRMSDWNRIKGGQRQLSTSTATCWSQGWPRHGCGKEADF